MCVVEAPADACVVLWGFPWGAGVPRASDKVGYEVNMVEYMTVEGDGPVAESVWPGCGVSPSRTRLVESRVNLP